MEKEFMERSEIKVICHVCNQEVAGKGVFTHSGDERLAHTEKHEHKGKICEGTGHMNPMV